MVFCQDNFTIYFQKNLLFLGRNLANLGHISGI